MTAIMIIIGLCVLLLIAIASLAYHMDKTTQDTLKMLTDIVDKQQNEIEDLYVMNEDLLGKITGERK